MKKVITKTVCELINGDTKVSFERIVTNDLEATRRQVADSTLNCKKVLFTYEEI